MRGAFLLASLAAAAIVLASCATKALDPAPARQSFLCAAGQAPCGTGCRPVDSVCCDDGTGKTSSYCAGTTAGCFSNAPRACTRNGAPSAFCCGPGGTTGSVDCPPGQHHCGEACLPLDAPCCSGDACPTSASAPSAACGTGVVLCGICQREQVCRACASGSCCSGDVCSNVCVKGDACTVTPPQPGTCNSSADCGSGMVCVSSRRCQLGQAAGACSCTGDLAGTCVDFSKRNLTVNACGSCTNDYTACCPGTLCVAGKCESSC